MPRTERICPTGEVFHVLNRSVARLTIFEKPEDYDAFLLVLKETWEEVPLPTFAVVVIPNHWHLVVRPKADGPEKRPDPSFIPLLTLKAHEVTSLQAPISFSLSSNICRA